MPGHELYPRVLVAHHLNQEVGQARGARGGDPVGPVQHDEVVASVGGPDLRDDRRILEHSGATKPLGQPPDATLVLPLVRHEPRGGDDAKVRHPEIVGSGRGHGR